MARRARCLGFTPKVPSLKTLGPYNRAMKEYPTTARSKQTSIQAFWSRYPKINPKPLPTVSLVHNYCPSFILTCGTKSFPVPARSSLWTGLPVLLCNIFMLKISAVAAKFYSCVYTQTISHGLSFITIAKTVTTTFHSLV